MISTILFIIIGLKLDLMNGWYLGLLITKVILEIIRYGAACVRAGAKKN